MRAEQRKCTATGSAAVFDVIMRNWFGIRYTTSNATSAETTSNAPTCSTTTVSTTLCAALQDDFHWWHTINDESDESGKLLLVDCNHNAKLASNERVIQVCMLFLLTHCKRSISLISWMVLILFVFTALLIKDYN